VGGGRWSMRKAVATGSVDDAPRCEESRRTDGSCPILMKESLRSAKGSQRGRGAGAPFAALGSRTAQASGFPPPLSPAH
jgi:hypothetical protein